MWRLTLVAPDHEEAASLSLIAQIAAAFRDVVRGEGVSLCETKVLDDYGSDADRHEAREWDTDIHWWELTDEDFYGHWVHLSYLDAEGLRYYLPAWMIHSLKILDSPLTGTRDTRGDTLDMLTYFDQSDQDSLLRLRERYPDKFPYRVRAEQHDFGTREKQMWALLTTEQSRVVCLYLRFVAIHGADSRHIRDAQKGLQQHWGQFCENGLSE